MTFVFREEDHSYWLGEQRLDSVTQILERSGIADYRFSNEDAKIRGTYVHRATEMIDRGTLDWSALDPVLVPYCRAYQSFIEDKRPEILISEKPMYHAQWLYGGTLDRIIRLDGMATVLDIKSGSPQPAVAIQVAAYSELARASEGIAVRQGCALYLREDGAYRFERVGHASDLKKNFNIFLAALTICRWKREVGV